ncbi:MAG: hypothetical protein F4X47_15305 [Gammaproteobacteria bacterium]|nr:hypothetical protein [Gammaproteobacteria bacterium]MYC53671.1 hypothetical protein [Gammaproteobacteria bacterium]
MRLPRTPEENLVNWSLGIALVCLLVMILFAWARPVEGQALPIFSAESFSTDAAEKLDEAADKVVARDMEALGLLTLARDQARLASVLAAQACDGFVEMWDLVDLFDHHWTDVVQQNILTWGLEDVEADSRLTWSGWLRSEANQFRLDGIMVTRECTEGG